MRLTFHARIEIGLSALLLLGSCDMPQTYRSSDVDKLDVADVNARNAISRVNALESRVEEIESRLDR